MQDGSGGGGTAVAPRMTRNSASLQSLEAAGHAAALADGLVATAAAAAAAESTTSGSRTSGRSGAGTRSGASTTRGVKHEISDGARMGAGEAAAAAAAAAAGGVAASTAGRGGNANTLLGAMMGGGGGHKKQKPPGLRRGKWTVEEEKYANRLIHEFKAGMLPLTDGTTLRTFLSIMLNCDPMRISKKFVGSNCIGKQVFRRHQGGENDPAHSEEAMDKSRTELADLERNFLERVAETTSKLKQGGGGGGAGGRYGGRSHHAVHGAGDPPITRASGPPSPELLGEPWKRSLDGAGGGGDDVKTRSNGAASRQAFSEEDDDSPASPAPPRRQRNLRPRVQLEQAEGRRGRVSPSSPRAGRGRAGGKISATASSDASDDENEQDYDGDIAAGRVGTEPETEHAENSSRESPASSGSSSSAKGSSSSRRHSVLSGVNGRGGKRRTLGRKGRDSVSSTEEPLGDGRDTGGVSQPRRQQRASQSQSQPQQQLQQHQQARPQGPHGQHHAQEQLGMQQQQQQQQQQQSLQHPHPTSLLHMHMQQRMIASHQAQAQAQAHVQAQAQAQARAQAQAQAQAQVQAQAQQQLQQAQQQQQPQPQPQPAMAQASFGFDQDGGPVPRAQALNSLPSNASISGSVSVQNLAMLLGMSGGSGGGLDVNGGASSHNFQSATDLGAMMEGMRSTPSSAFLRSSFGQLTDLQVENVNLLHQQQQQQQQHAAAVLGQSSGGASGHPSVSMAGGTSGNGSTMQVVPHFFMGTRRTSAEDFLSLLQDSEELQAREAQTLAEESDERGQSPPPTSQVLLPPPPPRLSSPPPSTSSLSSAAASMSHASRQGPLGEAAGAGGEASPRRLSSAGEEAGVAVNGGGSSGVGNGRRHEEGCSSTASFSSSSASRCSSSSPFPVSPRNATTAATAGLEGPGERFANRLNGGAGGGEGRTASGDARVPGSVIGGGMFREAVDGQQHPLQRSEGGGPITAGGVGGRGTAPGPGPGGGSCGTVPGTVLGTVLETEASAEEDNNPVDMYLVGEDGGGEDISADVPSNGLHARVDAVIGGGGGLLGEGSDPKRQRIE